MTASQGRHSTARSTGQHTWRAEGSRQKVLQGQLAGPPGPRRGARSAAPLLPARQACRPRAAPSGRRCAAAHAPAVEKVHAATYSHKISAFAPTHRGGDPETGVAQRHAHVPLGHQVGRVNLRAAARVCPRQPVCHQHGTSAGERSTSPHAARGRAPQLHRGPTQPGACRGGGALRRRVRGNGCPQCAGARTPPRGAPGARAARASAAPPGHTSGTGARCLHDSTGERGRHDKTRRRWPSAGARGSETPPGARPRAGSVLPRRNEGE